jgi:hypothetical protein
MQVTEGVVVEVRNVFASQFLQIAVGKMSPDDINQVHFNKASSVRR